MNYLYNICTFIPWNNEGINSRDVKFNESINNENNHSNDCVKRKRKQIESLKQEVIEANCDSLGKKICFLAHCDSFGGKPMHLALMLGKT